MQYPVLNKDSIPTDISSNKAKIPILLKGNWHVPGYGPLLVTDSYIDKVIENFNSNVLGFKPYATLGHLTDSPDPESVDGERKRGDLQEIIKEGDVVYGLYDINSETYNLIKNGDYQYSSPEIQDNFRDKRTGEVIGPTLLRTALTNAPFMPFNDHKIVTLSQGSNQHSNSICIKLSTNILSETIEETSEEIVESKEEPVDNTSELNNTQEQSIQMSTQNEVQIPTAPVAVETSKSTVDLEALILKSQEAQQALADQLSEITSKFSQGLEAVSNKTSEAVAAITSKVDEISSQVSAVTSKADNHNEYIVALSSSDKARRLNEKLTTAFKAGVSPAALETAKSIINNFDSASHVVKLSVKGNETEVSFEDAIISLLKLSSNAMPEDDQTGAVSGQKAPSYLDTLIAENKAKASKIK
jgi:hypothetical protein